MIRPARVRSVRSVPKVALIGLVALMGLVGFAGCAGGFGRSGEQAGTQTDLGWEGQALEAIGFSTNDLTAATISVDPSATPGDKRDGHRPNRFKRLRFGFGHGLLHGEAVVQTDEGIKTVVVQRGVVTAIDASTITVKSTDGFSLTWTFANPIHVIEHRTQVQPSAIAVGATVGVAGEKQPAATLARLIVIPGTKQ